VPGAAGRRARPRVERAAPSRRRRRVTSGRALRESAARRLRRFRQGTALAVAVTGFVLVLWGVPVSEPASAQVAAQDTSMQAVAQDTLAEGVTDPGVTDTAVAEAGRAVAEARSTLRQLAVEAAGTLPKIAIALLVFVVAWLAGRAVRPLLRRALGSWQRAEAATVLTVIVVWLLAAAVALSVIAGDVRALVGSVGLLGLALSWALQTPIESFSAYLLNSFKGYYRVGDRIAVGDVFGDVYRIDLLTTTVWEAGGPDKPVQGAQPTGALTTFPNSEVLRANVVNYTRDFPYVWDEVVIGIANESDLRYALQVVAATAREVVGPAMAEPVTRYRALLEGAGLGYDIDEEPQVYLAPTDAWTNITVRYLVAARERRRWASALHLAVAEAFARPEHAGRIAPSYPVTRVDLRSSEGEQPG
jgi:small conductance mechanosensitive channel